MSNKEVGMILVVLVLVQGFIAILLSYGFNGKYFKNSKTQTEALSKLRSEKPITANIISFCYALCLIDLLIAILLKVGRH